LALDFGRRLPDQTFEFHIGVSDDFQPLQGRHGDGKGHVIQELL